MITITVRAGKPARTDAIAWFVPEDPALRTPLLRSLCQRHSLPNTPFRSGTFLGKDEETLTLFPGKGDQKRVILIGLGKQKDLTFERLRRGAARAAKAAQASHSRTLTIVAPEEGLFQSLPPSHLWSRVGETLTEGIILGLYRFDAYKSEPSPPPPALRTVTLLAGTKSRAAQMRSAAAVARIACAGTTLARDLANAPGNALYPASLATRAQRAARGLGIRMQVLGKEGIAKLRMGGVLGVAQGSARPPRFIVMDYNRRKASAGTVVLVGKGVTFDSGGISIKPSAQMAEMKMDMSGAAAVIGALQASARLRLPLRIVGLIPAVENLPSGDALKPGDIIRHLNGKTSEVDNTDAEGRLILADALSYASRFSPDLVIDLATLTGAVVVALGNHATGMFGNNPALMEQLREAGDRTYERVWPLPLFDEYEKQIKSDIADVKNVGGRWGGAITAALFLKHFVGDARWVHLDIAGTAIIEDPSDYIPKGGSGVGVRLLVEFLRQWKKPKGSRT